MWFLRDMQCKVGWKRKDDKDFPETVEFVWGGLDVLAASASFCEHVAKCKCASATWGNVVWKKYGTRVQELKMRCETYSTEISCDLSCSVWYECWKRCSTWSSTKGLASLPLVLEIYSQVVSSQISCPCQLSCPRVPSTCSPCLVMHYVKHSAAFWIARKIAIKIEWVWAFRWGEPAFIHLQGGTVAIWLQHLCLPTTWSFHSIFHFLSFVYPVSMQFLVFLFCFFGSRCFCWTCWWCFCGLRLEWLPQFQCASCAVSMAPRLFDVFRGAALWW